MGKGIWIMSALFVVSLIGHDAMAACPLSGGGGRGGVRSGRGSVVAGRKGVTSDGRNKVKRPMGKRCGSSQGGGCNAAGKSANFRKWALPASVDIADLDTSAFDAAREALRLNDEQAFKIDKAIKEITDERNRVLKEQSDARSEYSRARGYNDCIAAARRVMSAATNCKKLDPNKRFEKALFALLSDSQQNKYRRLKKNS